MADYRIEFTITRRLDGEADFAEVGFGSSGAWGSVDQAAQIVEAMVQHGEWETGPGMPEPSEITVSRYEDDPSEMSDTRS